MVNTHQHPSNTPAVPVAEQAVLAAMLKDNSNVVRAFGDGLTADHFHTDQHRALFEIIQSQHHYAEPTDAISVANAASLSGKLASAGGIDAISSLAVSPIEPAHWTHHVAHLAEAHARRIAIDAANEIAAMSGTTSSDAIASAARLLAERVSSASQRRRAVIMPNESAKAFVEAFEAQHAAGDMPGHSTGIHEIDEATGGLRPGEFIVVCAETSGGKSALCVQISAEFMRRGGNILFVTLELSAAEVVGRFVTALEMVDYGIVTRPRTANKGSLGAIMRAVETVKNSGLHILDEGGMTIESIVTHAKQMADQMPLALIVVDYIQLVDGGRNKGESREQEVSRVSRMLKQLAKTCGCPLIAPSQLNDDGKVRESRSISHDCDGLFIISENGVLVGKARNSPRGKMLPLFFNGRMQRFEHGEFPDQEPQQRTRNSYMRK